MEERNTPKKLLAAAAPLFAQNGFDAVTLHQLSEAAKVNCSLFFYYFGCKEGLYLALLESQLYPLQQSMDDWRKNAASLSGIEQLSRYVDTIFTQQQQQPFLSQLLFNELIHPTACGQPLVQNYLDQSFRCIHFILDTGIQCGDFKPNLPRDCVKIMWYSILNFHVPNNIIADDLQPLDEHYADQCIDMLLNGIIQRRLEGKQVKRRCH